VLSSALCSAPTYLFDGVETKQVLVAEHGGGHGSIGPGSLTATDIWGGRACDGGMEMDAEIIPVKATNNAKMRIAVFIFGNLIH
jgi:hypothetical protein